MRGHDARRPGDVWKAALPWTAATVLLALARSLYVIPWLYGATEMWAVAYDVWVPVDAATPILAGDPLHVYGQSPFFISMPLAAALMAPPRAVASALGLVIDRWGTPYHAKPGSWPLMVVWGAAWSVLLYAGALRLAERLAPERRLLVVAASAACVAWPTICWGHFEDIVVVDLITWSIALAFACDQAPAAAWVRAAVLVAIAGGIKQTAWLFVPVLAMAAPARLRWRVALVAVSIPAVLVAGTLLADAHAWTALLDPTRWPGGIVAPWSAAPRFGPREGGMRDVGSVARLLTFPIAFAAAWAVWRRRTGGALLAGALVVSAGRVFCEPIQWPYYWAPVLWFCCCLLVLRERAVAAALLSLYAIAISELYPPPPALGDLLPPGSAWWWALGVAVTAGCSGVALHELFGRVAEVVVPPQARSGSDASSG